MKAGDLVKVTREAFLGGAPEEVYLECISEWGIGLIVKECDVCKSSMGPFFEIWWPQKDTIQHMEMKSIEVVSEDR